MRLPVTIGVDGCRQRDVCPICESPHKADIGAALTAGQGYRTLARRFGLDVAAVKEHRRQCLTSRPPSPPPPPPPPPKLPLKEPYAGPAGAHAPAREEHDPRSAVDFDSRVAFVIAAMTAGDFDAPHEVPLLAAAWGLTTDHTRRIVKAAGAGYRAATPDLDALRASSMGRWMHLYRAALAADDLRAACVALRGHDVVSGVANAAKAPESPLADPDFLAAMERLGHLTREALDVAALCVACPEVPRPLVAALVAAVEAELDRRLSEAAPPSPFPIPLPDVLAARDAIRTNTEGAYARAREKGVHGAWT